MQIEPAVQEGDATMNHCNTKAWLKTIPALSALFLQFFYGWSCKLIIPFRSTVFMIVLCMGIGQLSFAQKPLPYETISTAQGLSQGMVLDLLQDKEGFIWVATKNGLNRYDGYTFKVFTNDPYNTNTISSSTVVKLFEDPEGHIWVGTEDAGLNIYNKKNGRFYRIAHKVSDAASLSGNSIGSMEQLPDGRMLVAAKGAGLNIIQLPEGFFEKEPAPAITRLTLPNNVDVSGMGKDNTGKVWIGGQDGSVYKFDPSKNSFVKLPGAQLLENGYITRDSSILRDRKHFFLFNGRDAIPLFNTKQIPEGNIIFWQVDSLLDNKGIDSGRNYEISKLEAGKPIKWGLQIPKDKRILYPFIVDRSGIIWTGTVGYGLRKFNTAGNKFTAHLPQFSVRSIIPAQNGDIYLGDFDARWKKLKQNFTEDNALENIRKIIAVDNFLITKAGDYWIQNDQKGYYNYNPSTGELVAYPAINNGEPIGDKQPMLEDSKGYIWLPGLGGIITRFHVASHSIEKLNINTNAAKPMSPKAGTTALFEDAEGTFWVGTQDGFAKVVFRNVNNTVPQVIWFYHSSTTRNSLNYNHVSAFMNDPAEPGKYLWIGTKGGGLNRFDKTTGEFLHLTDKEGLPDNVVYGILPDDAGNIWGSTNKGIFCLASPKKNNGKWIFRNFTKAEGLQDDEFNTGAYAKLPNGNLAFGGVNGLNIFNPAEILVPGFTPNVFVTDILVNNQSISAGDKNGVLQNTIEQSKNITLSYLQDILTLEFASLDFSAPLQNKYRYQLEGIDKDWVESGNRRSATYLHLPSGTYTFKVQGSNSQGIWSDKIAQLKITVLPPWWLTWWAYVFYVMLLAFAVGAAFRFYMNRVKLRAQLNYEQLEARRMKELDTLKTHLYTNITHEFRTPLTIILGVAQQMLTKPAENSTNGVNMILRNGQNLLKLVNEMLDLSKLETGKMILQCVDGDIIKFLRYIIESFHSLAESQQKGMHFLTDIDALYVSYDPEKLRQIVVNILSNALKFTPVKGNIYITVSKIVLHGNEPNITLLIKVKDTGIGIPEDQLELVFDRFYQLDNSATRAAEGTGIGLSLTRELVQLMKGEISVKSPPAGANKGTEFTVMLPMLTVPAPEEPAIDPEQESNRQFEQNLPLTPAIGTTGENDAVEKQLILLVEDNADVVAYIASCLPDYRLAVGKDGREGFEIATQIIPDLIVTDVMMPFVDGFELVRQLRADEHTSHIPIIMLTAKADRDSKMEGLQQGVDAYLEKPFNREELVLRIKKLLELRKKLQQFYLTKVGVGSITSPVELPVAETIIIDKTEDKFVKKVREAIEANLTNADFTVEQLCKLVFMSHSQLHRKLEALTGFSPNKFIRTIRLNKAKELLKDVSNSIASVALDCGFNDPGYFGRVFKKEFGLTPQEWRVEQS